MMAVDVIRGVGPGGNYLTVKHTQTHFRQELWQPNFLNRDSPETDRVLITANAREVFTNKGQAFQHPGK